jgi:hypothetical protein
VRSKSPVPQRVRTPRDACPAWRVMTYVPAGVRPSYVRPLRRAPYSAWRVMCATYLDALEERVFVAAPDVGLVCGGADGVVGAPIPEVEEVHVGATVRRHQLASGTDVDPRHPFHGGPLRASPLHENVAYNRGRGVVQDKEMGTVLHLRTINQTTEPRSQTILYGKVNQLRQLVRFPWVVGQRLRRRVVGGWGLESRHSKADP